MDARITRPNEDPAGEVPPGYVPCPLSVGDFGDSIGPFFMRPDGSGFACRMARRHSNPLGVVHGGVLMTLADQVLGLTVHRATGLEPSATVSLNCDFVEGARPGDLIEGEAEVTRVTRSLVFAQGRLRCGDRLILTASGLWKRLQPARPR